MSQQSTPSEDDFTLVLTRDVPVSAEKLFYTWHSRLTEWFAPKPWSTPVADLDFRSGGHFRTVMKGPEGEEFDNTGVFLEVVENKKIVFTDAYRPGWVPNPELFFTAIITFEALPDGRARYTATARHWTSENTKKHAEMGFHQGWGVCLDQLVALASEA